MLKEEKLITNKEVKSSAFAAYFGEPGNAARLFEALEPGVKVLPEEIDFTTLNGVLFMARKNDLAFTVKKKVLVISEHQATINLNMPLRDAIYYGRNMEKLIEPKALYRKQRIPLPTPEFYVFYNGNDDYPAEEILRLSDSYLEKTEEPMLDLTVKVININFPENHPILERCRPLYEYSWFIQRIKDCQKAGRNRDEAIVQAIKDCLEAGMMADFLAEHGSEAVNMLYTEFNMEDALEVRFEEGVEKGITKSEERQSMLYKKMKKDGRIADYLKGMEDMDYLHTLYEEYDLM